MENQPPLLEINFWFIVLCTIFLITVSTITKFVLRFINRFQELKFEENYLQAFKRVTYDKVNSRNFEEIEEHFRSLIVRSNEQLKRKQFLYRTFLKRFKSVHRYELEDYDPAFGDKVIHRLLNKIDSLKPSKTQTVILPNFIYDILDMDPVKSKSAVTRKRTINAK